MYKFYGLQIDTPMVNQLDADNFEQTKLGKLNAINKNIALDPAMYYGNAEYIWRVVNVQFSTEDTVMTRFRAFDVDGRMLPEAVFGVWFSSLGVKIKSNFRYPPKHGTQYYVPQDNRFMTQQEGGYEVQVLDRNYPSDTFKFGLVKNGYKHDALIIDFRLFKVE